MVDQGRGPERGGPGKVVENGLDWARYWLNLGEDLILIAVAVVLVIAGFILVIESVNGLLSALAADRSIAETIIGFAENALLALILAELVHSLLLSLHGAGLNPEPFLIIAIVAILRKILLTAVQIPKPPELEGLLTPIMAELLGLTVVILVLVGALALARHTRAPGQEAPESKIRGRSSTPSSGV